MKWQAIIGLEIHVQLNTASKIFSGAANQFGAEANSLASAIDLGLPGVLPVLNKVAVEQAIRFGLAINAQIAEKSTFARKNYFYPDLPKGYQISQYEQPIVTQGAIDITVDGQPKTIAITRAHLEEDAGKSMHHALPNQTGIDFNRAGVPLLEIVSEPLLHSAKEAMTYMKAIHRLVTYLDICDGTMQQGSLRCDANVSICPFNSKQLGTRTEIKNLNSFRFIEQAIDFEIQRQIKRLEAGKPIIQETRLYDEQSQQTYAMRNKEEAQDYRYFPDPDLLPVLISKKDIQRIKQDLPELPSARYHRFVNHLGLSGEHAYFLTGQQLWADYFEAIVAQTQARPCLVANWLVGEFNAQLKQQQQTLQACSISTQQLATLLTRLSDATLSTTSAKQLLAQLWHTECAVDQLIAAQGLAQLSDHGQIEQFVDDVLSLHPQQVEQYKQGQNKVLSFFVGQVMKASQGKANPSLVSEILVSKLNS